MSIEVPRGATVWMLLEQNKKNVEVRVFATRKGARDVVDGRLKEEAQAGRVWESHGDISGVDCHFVWVCGKDSITLRELLVRRP